MTSTAAKPARWYHAWRSTPRPAPDTDPADLGTAFGLELSMSEPAELPAPAGAPRLGWMRRLAGRHSRPVER